MVLMIDSILFVYFVYNLFLPKSFSSQNLFLTRNLKLKIIHLLWDFVLFLDFNENLKISVCPVLNSAQIH